MPSAPISRRSVLGAGAGVALLGSAGAAEARAGVPLAGRARLQGWTEHVASMGIRLTGSPAQARYVDWLAAQWTRAGLHVQTDRLSLTRWTPKRWALEVAGKPVDVSFYFPYSGTTPPAGVSAPLMYLGESPASSALWQAAAGKIAVVDVTAPPGPPAGVFNPDGRYPQGAAVPTAFPELAVTDIALGLALEQAETAGVAGIVCLRSGVSTALAADQYSPFTTGYLGTPAVWVAPAASGAVRRAALAGDQATLTMDASLTPKTATETIWAVLPGASGSKEAIVVNTHTDGPNIAEENGGIGLLSMARHFAAVPRSRRRRSLIFVGTTGHFQLPQFAVGGGQSASRWIADHPELVKNTVAALTLEHLGCREWLDDANHQHYRATGANEPGWCFTSTGAMRRAYLTSAAGTANERTFTCEPGALYLGEGADFHTAGIPTASLIPGPSYLVAAQPGGSLQHMDYRLMQGQIATFTNLVNRLNTMSVAQIGTPPPT